jgi:hypothetical protein
MRTWGQGRWSWSHAVLILAVDKGDWLALGLDRFNPGKTTTGWIWWAVWVALVGRVGRLGEDRNSLSLPRVEHRILDRLALKEVTKSTDLLMAGNGMFICRRLSEKQI